MNIVLLILGNQFNNFYENIKMRTKHINARLMEFSKEMLNNWIAQDMSHAVASEKAPAATGKQ